MAEFDLALREGLLREFVICQIIKDKRYPSAYVIAGHFKGYDIAIPEIDSGIEVKCDWRSIETGNLVVEIEMYDKPSGLLTTTAKQWVFCDDVNLYFISPDTLKDIIIWNGLKAVKFIGNGDKRSKRAYLVKKNLITDKSFVLPIANKYKEMIEGNYFGDDIERLMEKRIAENKSGKSLER